MAPGKEKTELLLARMQSLGIQENDLLEKFVLGSGRGGQKINKTSSCVYLKHVASGIEIKCQQTRLRHLNRYYARKLLCDKMEEETLQKMSLKQQAIEKIRRQKRKRSRRAKEKMLKDKKQHSQMKALRQKPCL